VVKESEFHKLRERLVLQDPTLMDDAFISTLPQLLEVLGHPDGEIRDTLGWSTLSEYFTSSLCPPHVRIQTISLLLSRDFLFFEIENGKTDASVKRSFASLTLADIIGGDIKNECQISSDTLSDISHELCRYLTQERDWRGYEPTLGWIHALAHVADAFWSLASHPKTRSEDLSDCLDCLLSYIERNGQRVFMWQEDYRLGRALSVILKRLPFEDCRDLLERRYPRKDLFNMPSLQNLLTTVRCIYLELMWEETPPGPLLETLKKVIY